jgi:myo-inositol 2-dehydrogenase / D-chiro-inositol 1-dehydrogenase
MTMKVAIFGAGWFGKKHAELVSKLPDAVVCGVCSPRIEKAREAAAPYGAKGYDRVEEMLDDCNPDAAIIAVPPFAHGEIEYKLIERRIPFLVEKPIGLEMDMVDEIHRRIQEAKLTTSVGYHFRYTDAAAKAKEWLKDRTVVMAWGRWLGDMPGVYWWRNESLSGGQFIEQTTHMADLLRYLCGEAVEVAGSFGHVKTDPRSDEANVSDSGAATVRLANGSIAVLANSCAMKSNSDVGLDIYTDRGRLSIGFDGVTILEGDSVTKYPNEGDPYIRELEAFLHAVRTGDSSQILSDYTDAVKSFRLTEASIRSSKAGTAFRLDS